ncbi:MAG: hypothetical protein AB1586_17240 [Pseudomonadota bacterium]|jgi:hypothetical protein
MLLLWIGSAIVGGGFLTALSGCLVLDTQFGSSLLVGGSLLVSCGLAVSALGLALRKLDRLRNDAATDMLGTRVARAPCLPVGRSSLGESGTSLAHPR